MKKHFLLAFLSVLVICGPVFSSETSQVVGINKKAGDYSGNIPVKTVRQVKLPKGYHEGIFIDKDNARAWINNGEKGKTWVVSLADGAAISEIDPISTFTEGVTSAAGGKYWVTDWDEKKLYRAVIENGRMKGELEVSFAPSYVAGVVFTGQNVYLLTWSRGIGTVYHLVKLDADGNIIEKIKINDIPEPSQLAWDGKYLWMSSWYNKRIYKVDPSTYEILGYFYSPAEDATGIFWDGKFFWVTGTYDDLYQVELLPFSSDR